MNAVARVKNADDVRLKGAYVPDPGQSMEWPLALFEGVEDAINGNAIDLTGQQKTLLFGPYVQLPVGIWQARMRFAIDPQGGEVQARFDWGSLEGFSTEIYLIRHAGEYEVRLHQNWDAPRAAEFRAFTCRPSFGGHIRFQAFVVERVADSNHRA